MDSADRAYPIARSRVITTKMAWRFGWLFAACLALPTVAHAGPLDDMRDEVDDDDDGGGGGGGGWSSDDTDDCDECESPGTAIGAAIGAAIIEHNHALGRPAFARYPYEQRRGGSLPYTGWVHRTKQSSGLQDKSWSLRVAMEGAYLGDDLWRSAWDIEIAWRRLSLRSETGFYIERGFVDALWMGSVVGYIAFVMQPKVVWRVGLGPSYVIDARRVDDPERVDAAGIDGSTSLDVFPVRPLVLSGRADIGKLGGALTVSARGTFGVMVRRFEGYGGYEYRAIGRVKTHGPVFGVRVWF